jgi:hypothetical protein
MTSSALFIIVAESTEILRPMTQFGCAQACSGVTVPSVSGARVRNGPPEAVRMILSMRRGQVDGSSGSDWKMAECSLSIGSSVAPPSRTVRMNRSPPTTSASLLASSSRLPARAAARQGARPAAPTMAAMTASTSSCDAIFSRASSPVRTTVSSEFCLSFSASSAACGALAMTAKRGENCAHCASSSSTLVAAESANTSKRSGWREMTSSVLTPTEPVEPSTVTRCLGVFTGRPASWQWEARARGHPRGRERRRGRAAAGCCPWRRRCV